MDEIHAIAFVPCPIRCISAVCQRCAGSLDLLDLQAACLADSATAVGRVWCLLAAWLQYFIVCTPISYLVGRERIFDDVTANNSNEYVTIKVDRHVVLAYT